MIHVHACNNNGEKNFSATSVQNFSMNNYILKNTLTHKRVFLCLFVRLFVFM